MLGLAKWERGQKEHGGQLDRKPVLHEAYDEALDMVCYLGVLRRQHARAKALLADALANQNWDSVERAFNILRLGNEEGTRFVP